MTLTIRDADGVVVNTVNPTISVSASVGPTVSSLTFNRKTDTAVVTFQDSQNGMNLDSLSNWAFYGLAALPTAHRTRADKVVHPKKISITPGSSATSPVVVTLRFARSAKENLSGRELLTIISANSGTGIDDNAGNPLDGNFSGRFPSRDGDSGGNFVAEIGARAGNIRPGAVAR
jgi:hypothetical protein